jgi:uncharacterized protein YkwD
MKTVSISVLVVLLVALVSCKDTLVEETSIESPLNISVFQQAVLDEINLVRTDPTAYAELRLKSDMENSSDNGSYLYLKNSTPIGALRFSNILNLSASNYALFLSERNLIGHDENGTPLKRAIFVGFEGTSVGENIAACSGDRFNSTINPQTAAISFVRIMIIDDGVEGFAHRLTMLNSKYKTIGIGFSRNTASTYINYNVQDFGNQ